jgi:hypothetical protein
MRSRVRTAAFSSRSRASPSRRSASSWPRAPVAAEEWAPPPRRAPLVLRAEVPRRDVPVERFAVERLAVPLLAAVERFVVPLLGADERREVPLLAALERLAVERLGVLLLPAERLAVERLPEERDDDEPRDDEPRLDFGCGMNLSPSSDARHAIAEDKRASFRAAS